MDKGLTVPKWVQMPQNLFAKFVCPSPKVLDFNEKRLHWASVVRDSMHDFGYAAKVKLATIALQ